MADHPSFSSRQPPPHKRREVHIVGFCAISVSHVFGNSPNLGGSVVATPDGISVLAGGGRSMVAR